MPCPHLKIKITQRSKRQSAVAGAAYQSGESLFSEYDQKRKSYTEKRGIIYTESCCRQTLRPNMLTVAHSGTPLKQLRSNGTPSLPEDLL